MEADINYCKLYFGVISASTFIIGVLVNFCEPYLPIIIVKTFRYGKYALKQDSKLVQCLEVPKSYFRHFYITTAFFTYPILYSVLVSAYFSEAHTPPVQFLQLMDFVCGKNRVASVSATRTLIVATLLMLQVYRRCYDTVYVSVFSSTATMNLAHYLIGMSYYPLVMLTLLSEAPAFAAGAVRWPALGALDAAAVALFLWAWYHQHVCTVLLARLRKDRAGDVANERYQIPHGDWFEHLSSPHSTAEIVMYAALSLLLVGHTGWWYVLAWIVINQVETIMLSHWWYQSQFKNFPKNRKALVPALY